jgi:hypothetical protein
MSFPNSYFTPPFTHSKKAASKKKGGGHNGHFSGQISLTH